MQPSEPQYGHYLIPSSVTDEMNDIMRKISDGEITQAEGQKVLDERLNWIKQNCYFEPMTKEEYEAQKRRDAEASAWIRRIANAAE